MRVISNRVLREFGRVHPDAASPLQAWRRLMETGSFASFAQLKATFGSVDKVGSFFVFNMGGNKYRLVTAIHFNRQMVFVRAVMTHSEYDAGRWKERGR